MDCCTGETQADTPDGGVLRAGADRGAEKGRPRHLHGTGGERRLGRGCFFPHLHHTRATATAERGSGGADRGTGVPDSDGDRGQAMPLESLSAPWGYE